MPETVERMSEYWFKRAVVMMDAESLDRQRINEEREREMKHR